MFSASDLRLDWCSHQAAAYAVKKWHYSQSLPPPPMVKIGVWEKEQFIGCVLFARGANNNMLKPYGLTVIEGCELVRVALGQHVTPVSRIVAIAIRMLRQHSPGLRLIVSFADPEHKHHGGIYQAGGWLYCGPGDPSTEFVAPDGKQWHGRMVSKTGVKKVFGARRRVWRIDQCKPVERSGKHRYLMPLDAAMRVQLQPLIKPYPKRPKQAMSGHQPEQRRGSTDPDAPIS